MNKLEVAYAITSAKPKMTPDKVTLSRREKIEIAVNLAQ
jgi:hypothetical protein